MADDFDDTAEKEIRNTLIKKAQQLKTRRQQRWNANFGMIASLGGVIIVPILLGVFCGGWLDKHFPVGFSWRLSLLFFGFVWGLANAYYWIKNEEAKIEKNEQKTAESLKQGEKNGR